jgi:hypothetical protein
MTNEQFTELFAYWKACNETNLKISQDLRIEIMALAELCLNIAEASGQDRDKLKAKHEKFLKVQRDVLDQFPLPGEQGGGDSTPGETPGPP